MTDLAKKQYLLSSSRQMLPQMQEYSVGEYYLYVHLQLQHITVETKNGKPVWLLGHAYCMDAPMKTPADDLAAWDGNSVENLTRFWSGRWVLITEEMLVTDACGLMSAFYRQQENGWCISSSLALLCQVSGKKAEGSVSETGLSWQLLPNTRVEEIKAPLCTQRIQLGKALTVVSHNWITDHRALTGDEKCRQVSKLLVNGMKNIHTYSERTLSVALTGGKDSRLVLSALLAAQVPFESYTAAHSSISTADRKIPAQLAKKFNFSHRYIKAKSADPKRLQDYDAFTAGNSNGADRQFYAREQFESLNDRLVIRGGFFEAAQSYARTYTGETPESFAAGMRRYYSALTADPNQREAFEKWLKNAAENPIPYIDIRDRFYVEQRIGGWGAAIEQSLDMNDFVSIQVANCAALLSVLLSADDEQRKDLTLSYGAMALLEPEVLAFSVNKPALGDKLRRVLSIARNPVRKLQNYINRK